MKKKMREFQNNMDQQNSPTSDASKHPNTAKQKNGDYIDFEEVKS
jgi:hypothetical protein